MSHKPTKTHNTSNLPPAKPGDIAFHTDTRKPMFWDNGWHQFDNEYRGPVDLFIIAGQSNAHGHALVSGLNDDQIITNDVMFHTSWHQDTSNATTTQYYSDWTYDVVAGSTRGSGTSTTLTDKTQFGPELGFARRAKQLSSTRAKIGIVKHAIGASTLSEGEGRDIVVHNGVLYRCIKTHQDTDSGSINYHLPAVTEPGAGSDWQTYWTVDTNNVYDTDSTAVIGNYIVFLKDKYFSGDQQTIASGTPALISSISETVIQIPNTHSSGFRNLAFNNLGDLFGYSPAFDWTSGRDYNGTDLSDWDIGDFPDNVRSGDALRAWKRTVNDAISKLTQLNITYRWRGLIWWQGESGTNTTVVQELMNHMRNYVGEPELPTILTRIGYGTGNTWTSPDVFTNMTNVSLVDASEYGHGATANHVGHDNGEDPRQMFNIGMDYANKFAELYGETPIAKIQQTITFAPISDKVDTSAAFQIDAVSTSGMPITYTSSDTSVATVSDGMVTITGIGQVTITASQAGDGSYLPADAPQTFTVSEDTSNVWVPDDTFWWLDASEPGAVQTVDTAADKSDWVADTTSLAKAGDIIRVKTSVTLNQGGSNNTFSAGDILEVWMIQSNGGTTTTRDPNNPSNFAYLSSGRNTSWEIIKPPVADSGSIYEVALKTSPGTLRNFQASVVGTSVTTGNVNGLTTLYFGEAGGSTGDTQLTITNGHTSNAIPTGSHIWYWLIKPIDIGTDGNSNSQDGLFSITATGNTYIYLTLGGSFWFGANKTFDNTTTGLTNNQTVLLSFELDWDNDTVKQYVNGELVHNNDASDSTQVKGGVASDLQAPTQNNVWSIMKHGPFFLEGDFMEWIASDDVSTTTRQKTEGYLAHKWGFADQLLSTNGADTHPYKSSSPEI